MLNVGKGGILGREGSVMLGNATGISIFKSIPKSGRLNTGNGGIEGKEGSVIDGKTIGI